MPPKRKRVVDTHKKNKKKKEKVSGLEDIEKEDKKRFLKKKNTFENAWKKQKGTVAEQIFTRYRLQISKSIYLFLRSIPDDVLIMILSQPNLKEVFTEYLKVRGDIRDCEQKELRDFVHQYYNDIKSIDDKNDFMDTMCSNLSIFFEAQKDLFQDSLIHSNDAILKVAKQYIRETLPLWIAGKFRIAEVKVVWWRGRVDKFTHETIDMPIEKASLVNVPLSLIQINDSKNHLGWEQLPYSQYGINARKYLFSPKTRSILKNEATIKLPKLKKNHLTWPSVQAHIDVDLLFKDRNLFDWVFQKFTPEISEEIWENPTKFTILLDSHYLQRQHYRKEAAKVQEKKKAQTKEIMAQVQKCRKQKLFPFLSDEEVYAMYEKKYITKVTTIRDKASFETPFWIREKWFPLSTPYTYVFLGRKLYKSFTTASCEMWSIQDLWNSKEEPYLSVCTDLNVLVNQFPSYWDQVVQTFRFIFTEHYRKSENSHELSIVLQEIMTFLS